MDHPERLVGVLFPAFATAFAQGGERAAVLFDRGIKVVYLALLPAVLAIILLGKGVGLWLGDEFARQSTGPLQWLAVGVFLNSLAMIPFVLIQAAGRPDLTAKFHMVELAIYAPLLWLRRPVRHRRRRPSPGPCGRSHRLSIPDGVLRSIPGGRQTGARRLRFVAGAALPAVLIGLRPATLEVRAPGPPGRDTGTRCRSPGTGS